jgi:hypothetical protein
MKSVFGVMVPLAILVVFISSAQAAIKIEIAEVQNGVAHVKGNKAERRAIITWEGQPVTSSNPGGVFSFDGIIPADCVGTLSDGVSTIQVVVLDCTPGSQASNGIVNGGFETGDLTGWEAIGDALVVDTSVGSQSPGRGGYQALITNAPSGLIFGEHPQTYSGNNSVDANSFGLPFPTPPSPLEIFLGLGSGSLRQLAISTGHGVPAEGSAIKQTFTANAGDILQFNWQYLTDEKGCCSVDVDFAFVVLDGNVLFLADVSAVHHDSDTPFFDESAYTTFVVRLATGGTHTIGVGVIDTYDSAYNSGVLVDNVRIVPGHAQRGQSYGWERREHYGVPLSLVEKR